MPGSPDLGQSQRLAGPCGRRRDTARRRWHGSQDRGGLAVAGRHGLLETWQYADL